MSKEAVQIGVVNIAHGTVTAEGVDGVRELTNGSPVFVDDAIVTGGKGSAVEIKFNDGALLSQGPNSSVVLDHYVFDPDQDAGEMTVKMLQGTFRSVTGEIVDMNPEGFSLETPLATIGIRGTTTGHTIGADGQENHVVVDFVDKPVVVRPVSGGPVRVITRDGMGVTATPGGLSPVMQASQSQLSQFQQLSSQSLQNSAPDFNGDTGTGDEQGADGDGGNDGDTGDDGDGDNGDGENPDGDAADGEGDGEGEGEGEGPGEGEGEGEGQGEGPGDAGEQGEDGEAGQQAGNEGQGEDGTGNDGPGNQGPGNTNPGGGIMGVIEGGDEGDGFGGLVGPAQPGGDLTGGPGGLPGPGDMLGDGGVFAMGGLGMPVGPGPELGGGEFYDDEEEVVYETLLDKTEFGAELTVDLTGEGSDKRSNPYYEETGNVDDAKITSLPTTIQTVYGDRDHHNVITGNGLNNELYGGTANNELNGEGGNDYMAVGTHDTLAGTFQLDSLDGSDIFHGGSGTDTVSFDGMSSDTDLNVSTSIEALVLGSSAVTITLADTVVDSYVTMDVDGSLSAGLNFDASGVGDSEFYMVGGSSADTLKGGTANSTINGVVQGDTLFGGGGNDELYGLAGNDTLSGTGGGKDTLEGGAGSDAYYMGTKLSDADGVDEITGDSDDTLYFTDNGHGINDLSGMSGVPNIVLGNAETNIDYDGATAVTVVGTALTHKLTWDGSGASVYQTVTGGSGNDAIMGGNNGNSFVGGLGDDQLTGGTSGDSLVGGAGKDALAGGDGNDTLYFSAGDVVANESIDGGGSSDFDMIQVVTSTDFTGADIMNVEKVSIGAGMTATFTDTNSFDSNWTVMGSLGTTETLKINVTTANGDVDLSTTTFDATWTLGTDKVYVTGESGNNSFKVSNQYEKFIGGSGSDAVDYSGSGAGVNIDLLAGTASGGWATGDTLVGIEGVTGSTHADNITGDCHDNVISTGDGNDSIVMGSFLTKDDVIDGGNNLAMGDTLSFTSSGSADELDGVTNVENITLGNAVTSVVTVDTLVAGGAVLKVDASGIATEPSSGMAFSWDGSSEVDGDFNLTGSSFNDSFAGGLGNDTFDGGDGLDWVSYDNAGAAVTLTLGNGSNGTATGNGADQLISIEKVWGSANNDNFIGLSTGWSVLVGGDGQDSLYGTNDYMTVAAYYEDPDGVYVQLAESSAIDGWGNTDEMDSIRGVDGSGHDDTIFGNWLDNYFQGFIGDDAIYGGEGDDTVSYAGATSGINVNLAAGLGLDGMSGVDILTNVENVSGSKYNDSIVGDDGGNVLDGGIGGRDTLDGGDNDFDKRELDVARYTDAEGGIVATLGDGNGTVKDTSTNITDTIKNMEGVMGTEHDDVFTGDSAWVNIFFDMGGSDVIDGNSVWDENNETGMDIVSYEYMLSSPFDTGITAEIDTLNGSGGTDWLVTDYDGNTDTLRDIDMIWGTIGKDSMTGDATKQQFTPSNGSDTIDGGGGSADDVWTMGSENGDEVSYYNLTEGITLTWDTDHYKVDGTLGADAWTDLLYDVECVEGTQVDDSFTGLTGTAINESFNGYSGNDNINGGDGMDWAGYWNNPALYEGGAWKGVKVDLTGFTIGATSLNARDGWGGYDTLSNIEGVDGSDFNDTILGDSNANAFWGDDGDDYIQGRGGVDTLEGCAGEDTFAYDLAGLTGGADMIDDFDAGDDMFEIVFQGSSAIWSEIDSYNGSTSQGGEGLIWDNTNMKLWYEDSLAGVHQVAEVTGDAVNLWNIDGLNASMDMTITDAATGDTVWTGDDSVANDSHVGTANNDTMNGMRGNDTLEGLAGDDVLSGGTGLDVFAYSDDAHFVNNAGTDTITDFESGKDIIELHEADAVHLSANNINLYSQCGYTGTGTGASGDILVWDPVNHRLWYDEVPGDADPAEQGIIAEFNSDSDFNVGDIRFTDTAAVYTVTDMATGGQMIQGRNGADVSLAGTVNNDFIFGNAGGDTLTGDSGDDLLDGGAQSDEITGGEGDDTVAFAFDSGGVVVDLGDAVFGYGTNIDGDIIGGAKDSTGGLDSIVGAENIIGSSFDDKLFGDSEANQIMGDDGADYLGGMGGADTLTGGAGADTFHFHSTSMETVTIMDFDASMDMIALNPDSFDVAALFDESRFVTMHATTYDGTGAFKQDGGTGLVYASDSNCGELWYDADTSTTGDEVLLAVIDEQMAGVSEDNDLTTANYETGYDATGLSTLG